MPAITAWWCIKNSVRAWLILTDPELRGEPKHGTAYLRRATMQRSGIFVLGLIVLDHEPKDYIHSHCPAGCRPGWLMTVHNPGE